MIEVHITIELQASPRLVQLLEALQPGMHSSCVRAPRKPSPSMPSIGETESLLHPGPRENMLSQPMGGAMGEPPVPSPSGPEDPQIKPRAVKETPPGLGAYKSYILQEIPRFSDIGNLVDLPKQSLHLQYAETKDGRLQIRYLSGTVWTTWTEIMKAFELKKERVRIILTGNAGNRITAVNQFLKAVHSGLRRGHSFSRELEDPDADFRPHLKGVIDTSTRYDGGKLEGTLEG